MKPCLNRKRERGLTLVELLVVIAVITILALVFVAQPDRNGKARAERIQCVNNLKQIGLAVRISMPGGGDRYLMRMSTNQGGTMEFGFGTNLFRHFQVMSNELGTPRLLFCPSDSDRRQMWPTNFDSLNNSNISYFVGLDAAEEYPDRLLSGDRNLTNGTPIKNGILELTTNTPANWTAELHNKVGNLLLSEGSVQQVSSVGLQTTTAFTNRLLMPILGP